ncbi:hypothetical protein EVAR_55996_1 [Eumeta japonica]|uniref:Uncharacterized protein n=1 Tax=Eumeta variegata TaxID=151549 RepID=A0A4C1Z0I8_EUMVA|nr:hypothetical protein EVAR_55996_1 [Eumeta japonica]
MNSATGMQLERSQLLAEQRWLEEALRKIKSHRNALQIERLQLENMLHEVNNKKHQRTSNTKKDTVPSSSSNHNEPQPNITTINLPYQDIDALIEQIENSCNEVELNLDVNSHGQEYELGNTHMNSEEEDMDEDEADNLDFFMNVVDTYPEVPNDEKLGI